MTDEIISTLQQVSHDLLPLPPVYAAASDDVTSDYTIEPYDVFFPSCCASKFINRQDHADGISNWFLREFAFVISDVVCHIFQRIIHHRYSALPLENSKRYICTEISPTKVHREHIEADIAHANFESLVSR
jgi:hypothetical protein